MTVRQYMSQKSVLFHLKNWVKKWHNKIYCAIVPIVPIVLYCAFSTHPYVITIVILTKALITKNLNKLILPLLFSKNFKTILLVKI